MVEVDTTKKYLAIKTNVPIRICNYTLVVPTTHLDKLYRRLLSNKHNGINKHEKEPSYAFNDTIST